MRKYFLISFCAAAFLFFAGTCNVNFVYSQPEEEEEEPVQARPNPLEHAARGKSRSVFKEMAKDNSKGVSEVNAPDPVGDNSQSGIDMPIDPVETNASVDPVNYSNPHAAGYSQQAEGQSTGYGPKNWDPTDSHY